MNSNFNYEEEKQKLEKEKLEWEKIKKEQESRFQKENNILMSLQESILNYKLHHQHPNFNNLNNTSELESLKVLYKNKIKDLSTQINVLQEEQQLFYKYKENTISLLNKQIEQLNQKNFGKEAKNEDISEKLAEIEKKEKIILEEIYRYEEDKKLLTELYNEVIMKKNENKMRASDINDMVKELDVRKNQIERIKKELPNKVNEIKDEIIKVDKEKKKMEIEKNNLLLRLESIDLVGMKLINGKNMEEKEKNWQTQREKFYYETFSGNFVNPLKNKLINSCTENDFFVNKNEKNKTNFFN